MLKLVGLERPELHSSWMKTCQNEFRTDGNRVPVAGGWNVNLLFFNRVPPCEMILEMDAAQTAQCLSGEKLILE